MRSRSRAETAQVRRERGSVTAELAVALPAVVLVLACCLSAVQVAGQQLEVQAAAVQAARAVARGGDPGIASRLLPGSTTTRYDTNGFVCATVTVQASALAGALASITLTAHSCAPGGGQ